MAKCAHCGLPAPAGDPAFCCAGCETVFGALHASGLADFYRVRASLGERSEPASNAGVSDRYLRFDDADFQDQFCTAPGEIELAIEGAHCAACVWLVERSPRALDGFESARLDLGRGRVKLRWTPSGAPLSAVTRYLHRLGYATHPVDTSESSGRQAQGRDGIRRLGVAGASAGWTMMLALALYAGAGELTAEQARMLEWGSLIGAIPALTYAALPFYRSALGAVRLRVAHADLPIALALLLGTAGSVWGLIGNGQVYFDSLAVLVFLLLGARHIQAAAQRKAWGRGTLREALLPPIAVRVGGEQVSIGHVSAGDHLYVPSGAVVPADGRALTAGWVDRGLLTGESRPVPVDVGSSVFAGTSAGQGGFEFEVEAIGNQTRVGRLVVLIDEASRPPLVRMTDRWAGRFVVVVLALAALGGLGWSLVAPERAIDIVVALLVVSCPCALGLASPLVLAIARRNASTQGIWFSNLEAFERLAGAQRVVFDKTGTLTQGSPRVEREWGLDDELKGWIAALERESEHPLAAAVRGWAGTTSASSVTEQPGRGVEGWVSGAHVRVGSAAWLGSSGEAVATAHEAGLSVVVVEVDGVVVGGFAVSDPVRADARSVIDRLKARGLEISIASGDDPAVVARVAQQLGVDQATGGLDPEAKGKLAQDPLTVMVGDGINDAVALRTAGVGIAVSSGAEVALQVADVTVRGGPASVVLAIDGARAALRTVRRILSVSLLYNLVCAGLALAGQIDALAAAILMPASSLFVALSAVAGAPFHNRMRRPAAVPALDHR